MDDAGWIARHEVVVGETAYRILIDTEDLDTDAEGLDFEGLRPVGVRSYPAMVYRREGDAWNLAFAHDGLLSAEETVAACVAALWSRYLAATPDDLGITPLEADAEADALWEEWLAVREGVPEGERDAAFRRWLEGAGA